MAFVTSLIGPLLAVVAVTSFNLVYGFFTETLAKRQLKSMFGQYVPPELVEEMSWVLDGLPGMRSIFSQPIEMRVNEMLAGIRTDVGVKLFGDDFDILAEKAAEVVAL